MGNFNQTSATAFRPMQNLAGNPLTSPPLASNFFWYSSTSHTNSARKPSLLSFSHTLNTAFFLYLNAETSWLRRSTDSRSRRTEGEMEKFSNVCIIAALHTIVLTQTAYDGKYLPRCSIFVTYFLFAAALILLSNEFTGLSFYPASSYCIDNAIKILFYRGECNPQASRKLDILIAFRDVVAKKNNRQSPQIHEIPFSVSVPATDAQTTNFTSFQPSMSGVVTSSADFPTSEPIETPSDSQFDASAVANQQQLPTPPQPLPPTYPFSGLLDLTNNVLPTVSDGKSSGTDEHIDFHALWQWPGVEATNNTGIGTELSSLNYAGVQGISDSSAPLYGTVEMGVFRKGALLNPEPEYSTYLHIHIHLSKQ